MSNNENRKEVFGTDIANDVVVGFGSRFENTDEIHGLVGGK